jgi:glycosyltransferase involved in cell wall biosynthesis
MTLKKLNNCDYYHNKHSMAQVKPLVSVVVITYQSASFVVETLESIKRQTYQNIELIICDDGSKDETVFICSTWLENSKARFINSKLINSQTNSGIPSNCNRGCKVAEGEWIKLIAGDDVLTDDAIELNINHVLQHKIVKVLFSKMEVYQNNFDSTHKIKILPAEETKKQINEQNTAEKQFEAFIANIGHWGLSPTMFIERETLHKQNFFDEKYPMLEDLPLQLKLTKNGIILYWMDQLTVKYRRHTNNVSNNVKLKSSLSRLVNNHHMIREYIFPNITTIYKLRILYKYYVSLALYSIGIEKKTELEKEIHKTIGRRLNIFHLIIILLNKTLFNNIKVGYKLK